MTYHNMIEILQQTFPDIQAKQMLLDLNIANKLFCKQTSLLRSEVEISPVVNQVEYTIPTTVDLIYAIKFKDSLGRYVEVEDNLKYEIKSSAIKFYDRFGDTITTIPITIAKIVLICSLIPTTITSATIESSPSFPEDFHEALIEDLFEKYARRKGKVELCQMAQGKYKMLRIEAKKYANMIHDNIKDY